MGEATRHGPVEGIEIPDKGPGKAKVGGRVVRFWATAYGSQEPSDVLELLRRAAAEGRPATVVGEETQRSGPSGSYTQFMAQSVTLGDPGSNGNGSEPKQFVGREPGRNDNWTASRWALSAAIDVLGPGKDVADYTNTADQFLAASLQLADSLSKEAAGV